MFTVNESVCMYVYILYIIYKTPGDSDGQGSLACCSPWGSQTVGHDLPTEQPWDQYMHGKVGKPF